MDGQEYTALGNNVGCGFNVTNVSNATIQHTHIRQFECGIYLSSSTHIIIKNNTMANNIQGILLEYSSDNSISGNNVTDNSDGISLDESANNVLRNNILNGNKYDFFVLTSIFPNARKLSYFYQDIDESNTVNGKPMYYWINEHDRAVPSNAGYIALVNCSNIMVEGFTLTSKGKGVLLANTNNSKVTNNNLTNTSYSIWLYSSSNNDISGNSMVNVLSGVSLLQSHNNIILRNSMVDYRNGINLCESNDNNIFENSIANGERGKGISLSDSQDNNVSENDISNNRFGIVVSTSSNNTFSGNDIANITDSGFWLTMSLSNILSGNRVMNSDCGIDLYRSSKNLLAGNTLANNRLSMRAWSSNNRIYHNNFIDTFWNIIIDSGNIWDNGYPSGGNYWSDYYGTDLHWGPHQNLTGSDGIGDESHPIGSGDQDNYPLMNPWMIVDTIPPTTGIILPENITYHPPVPLNFTVCDPVHMSPISWIGYSLDSEANVTITGNTTLIDLSFGSHTITVHANDSSGNTGSSETVYFTVTFPTDLNLDGKVRIDDLLLGAQAFGTDPDHPRWNPAADINKDARIRVDDILAIALNFGQE
ncbi:MAG: right-handed parallel beta-helix repeat-containing protein [Candidatus Bathyarchaeota archaeon]|nr:right-handed parallel beta-helix repeat-containing protein [Candidatus Bathyarchaeota archaeon]